MINGRTMNGTERLIIGSCIYNPSSWEGTTEAEAYDLFVKYLSRLHECTSTTGKKNNGETCISLLVAFPSLPWSYDDTKQCWDDRFIENQTITNAKDVNEVPDASGVYLVGSTYFNPITDEKFYWIKVGKSVQLNKRMKQYATHNPMLWKNSFWVLPKDKLDYAEKACQYMLENISLEVADNTDEWFRVSREDYLAICSQGFNYFEPMLRKYRALRVL